MGISGRASQTKEQVKALRPKKLATYQLQQSRETGAREEVRSRAMSFQGVISYQKVLSRMMKWPKQEMEEWWQGQVSAGHSNSPREMEWELGQQMQQWNQGEVT